MNDVIRIREVARLTGLSENTLRRYIKRGCAPDFRQTPSGIYLFRRADVEKWFDSLKGPQKAGDAVD